ncbi:hypothetical protein [Desulfoscipio geothermicus]|uniref:Uncharacterized protein n=1 Tax=Desulfoscipio geothermicus DSM 3669 TaxID=1121426 RepID=A0A1I6EGI9_9FIRM|nr:hypothetical protein [Desulfoscipio geothermicus]SFR16866.1 hypothetical protein SAMN05660706_14222 [Desulfoscipio geothermicus DSM 3669]
MYLWGMVMDLESLVINLESLVMGMDSFLVSDSGAFFHSYYCCFYFLGSLSLAAFTVKRSKICGLMFAGQCHSLKQWLTPLHGAFCFA